MWIAITAFIIIVLSLIYWIEKEFSDNCGFSLFERVKK